MITSPKIMLSITLLNLLLTGCQSKDTVATEMSGQQERTAFQTSWEWKPTIDSRGDIAIIYGVGGNPSDRHKRMPFEERVQSWRDRGYTTHFMTGIAWGEYQDYFTGEWDGQWHLDEGQVQQNGDTIWHGYMVPYIVPSENYLEYLKEKHVKRVIDAGIDAIYMEELEFWSHAGYSQSFKKEWKKFYGFDWRPQHESPENTYLSHKLKYNLYYNALKDVFTFAKSYGKSKGMDVRCYVPTHSLINYSQWQIVSPEASLASLSCVDGYIAQVWTGTSRTPNYFNGTMKERVFETAFLEYGSMESMTAPTGRKMFFLTDPIEDWPRDWEDYKRNYQATFAAQLLYPGITNYEIMPWPERIYEGWYRTSADSDRKEQIPRFYATQMQVMINSLNHMPISDNRVSGSPGISILMANSLMFQSFPSHKGYEDPQFSNFYGQALPLLKRGIPVNTLHIENVSYPQTWKETKILIMTYANMKPLDPEAHTHIAGWVKNGGMLVYCGKDNDPFQTVKEWWNTDENDYKAPSEHLFQLLGLENAPGNGEYSCGKGFVYVMREDPKEFVLKSGNDEQYISVIKQLYGKDPLNKSLNFKNHFFLERGPYIIVSVLDESISDEPYYLRGTFIDLFDPQLPILQEKIITTGEQAYLYDINKINSGEPQVLAAAARIYNEYKNKNRYSFIAKSPINTTNVMRILLPSEPKKTTIRNAQQEIMNDINGTWHESSKTYLLTFENDPDGIAVSVEW